MYKCTTEKIKKGCPFCGTDKESILLRRTATDTPSFKVECPNCRMQTAWENSAERAIIIWHKRQ